MCCSLSLGFNTTNRQCGHAFASSSLCASTCFWRCGRCYQLAGERPYLLDKCLQICPRWRKPISGLNRAGTFLFPGAPDLLRVCKPSKQKLSGENHDLSTNSAIKLIDPRKN